MVSCLYFSFLWGLLGVIPSIVANNPPLFPPYTCTTTTTLCQNGVPDGTSTVSPAPTSNPIQGPRGREGKRGPQGLKGEKGEPCRCNASDEEMINEMSMKVDSLELRNMELEAIIRIASIAPASSCMKLKQQGYNESGIYTIQTNKRSSRIEVFCDMESVGGGWTLVASVHENNLNGKCTQGDLWSSEQGISATEDNMQPGNWENFNTFGTPAGATSADYKSQAYFSLQASDVMIWHVPNDVHIERAKDEASLIYYTNSSFLSNYGGNLRSLYSQHFPIQKGAQAAPFVNISALMGALNNSASELADFVHPFHSYSYDGGSQMINDGGGDMFDGGNKIIFEVDDEETAVTYNSYYKNVELDMELLSYTSHPFNLLMWIGNTNRSKQSYMLQVYGDIGADGNGLIVNNGGILHNGNFTLHYHSFGIYSSGDPSVFKVFYYITNPMLGSIATSVSRPTWSSTKNNIDHRLLFTDSPVAVLVGYTLLSKSDGTQVYAREIERVLSKVLFIVSNISKIGISCDNSNRSHSEPVSYLKGSNDQVQQSIPPDLRRGVEPGFIQFRAFNKLGLPNAMCSGIRVSNSCGPEYVCVGGMNTMMYNESSCGDFAAWQRDSNDSPSSPSSGLAKPSDDINSSILIFTRENL